MTVAIGGTTGPQGVLPSHYTELVIERLRDKDYALWDFLDLFNHRFVSLFYRAWEKYRFPSSTRGRRRSLHRSLFALIGLGTGVCADASESPTTRLLLYAGLLAQRPRSATAIVAMLGDYFGVPPGRRQFVGQWLALEPEDAFAARREEQPARRRRRLRRARLEQPVPVPGPARPAGLARVPGLPAARAPGGRSHDLVRFLVGLEFDFDVQLVLKKEEIPACHLGSRRPAPPMLGWTTWLKSAAAPRTPRTWASSP